MHFVVRVRHTRQYRVECMGTLMPFIYFTGLPLFFGSIAADKHEDDSDLLYFMFVLFHLDWVCSGSLDNRKTEPIMQMPVSFDI